MVEIGGRPILWHIMKIFTAHGITDFVICLGYRGYMVKEFFANYFLHTSDITFDLRTNSMEVHQKHTEPWKVTLVDTGDQTQTGGRLARVRSYLNKNEPFLFTYGDGLGDIDLTALIDFHFTHGRLATVTAVAPPGRFGALEVNEGKVTQFKEKPMTEGSLINGGFFVLSPTVIDRISGDHMPWEANPMESLVHDDQLAAYHHRGFWQPMDTLRDHQLLESLWVGGQAPWKLWD